MRLRYKTMKFIKVKLMVLTLLMIYLLMMYTNTKNTQEKKKYVTVTNVVLPYVVVHIDLKRMPPKLEYLESLLPELKNNGANGLLMEYEDMFPFKGKLVNMSRKDCYKKPELVKFITHAVKLGFEIIPLVQTFGHMEYTLKLQKYQHLREVPVHPDSICPNKEESHALIKETLKQVIYFHNRIFQMKYIHVGCDEVFHLNKCVDCQRANLSNEEIIIKHIGMVTSTVKLFSPTTTVLIWDDMLRKIKYLKWNNAEYFGDVNPVYWDYKGSVTVSNHDLLKYHRAFNNIWIASAFKGADGRTATFPNFKHRFMNHITWLNTITGYKFGGENEIYNFKGIILTGWSSYSHMDPPCELLPVSIHSLILNLYLIKMYKTKANLIYAHRQDPGLLFILYLNDILKFTLKCYPMTSEDFDFSFCKFDGSELYDLLKNYIFFTNVFIAEFRNDHQGIEYYAGKHNMMNSNNIKYEIEWIHHVTEELSNVEKKIIKVMKRYYTNDTIKEYMDFKTYYAKRIFEEFMSQISPVAKSINLRFNNTHIESEHY